MRAPTVYKTSINLPEEAVKAVQEMASTQGTTMAEVIRQAISTQKFLSETVKKGGKVLIEDKDSPDQRILLIR